MKKEKLEDHTVLATLIDSNENTVCFHLDRIPAYAHRYTSHIEFNGVRFMLGRYNTTRDALTFAELIKSLQKGQKC